MLPFASIIAAALLALISTSPLIMRKHRGSPIPFLPGSPQDKVVLFHISKQQRDVLLGKTKCSKEEFDSVFAKIAGRIRDTFHQEGYVIVRGLMDEEMVDRLSKAGTILVDKTKQGKSFTSLEFGPVFLSPPNCSKESEDEPCEKGLEAFREVSLTSAIPPFVAKMLLGLDESTQTLRILKDVFLAKGKEEEFCGWHVDDFAFWPTSTRATADTPGVNAWIAMDDIAPALGGGLAVSPKSHEAEWRHEAYNIIGSTKTYPEEGYDDPEDMFANSKTTTCSMAKVEPEFAKHLDDSMHVFHFRKGDVLFHTRWLFHRSVPITKAGYRHFERLGKDPLFMRYSIRYEVGEARTLKGFSIEGSVLLTPENSGKTLDSICATDAPWYPKCWPQVDSEELRQLNTLVHEKMPAAKTLIGQKMGTLMPVFQKKS